MKKLLSALILLLLTTTAFANILTLTSSAFDDREKLNSIYTCDGKNISPPLAWQNIPKNTVSFALIISDPDAPSGTFYHWVIYNLPKTTTSLVENITTLPTGTKVAKNTWDNQQYKGPCPPKGTQHRYVFTLYALDTMLNLADDANAQTVLDAIQNHIVGVAELKAMYAH